jgi:hypothetical protein
VPRALKTTDGVGVREERMAGHLDVLLSWIDWSLGDREDGRRREMVLMVGNASVARRVARIWEPTAPVQPKTAAVDIMANKTRGDEDENIYEKTRRIFEVFGF